MKNVVYIQDLVEQLLILLLLSCMKYIIYGDDTLGPIPQTSAYSAQPKWIECPHCKTSILLPLSLYHPYCQFLCHLKQIMSECEFQLLWSEMVWKSIHSSCHAVYMSASSDQLQAVKSATLPPILLTAGSTLQLLGRTPHSLTAPHTNKVISTHINFSLPKTI